MSLSDQTKTIYLKTLNAVSPEKVVKDTVWVNHKNQIISIADIDYNFNDYNGVYVFGFGKASVLMAKALEDQLVKLITDGMAISPVIRSKQLRAIQLFKGSHPLPDEESLSSSYEAVRFAKSIPDNALVINLISGGTSALFEIPEEPLDIDEIKKMYNLLIRSGAAIQEVNTVRIAFSAIKGGKFLQKLKNKTVVDLIISDVPGDDLKFIGSGPTIAQKISYSDAFQILKKY
ncbi:MAG: glycerate-2-kinase family protein, partial [Balneolaceae bacterium]